MDEDVALSFLCIEVKGGCSSGCYGDGEVEKVEACLLYTSPSPRDLSTDTLSRCRYQCSLDVVALYTTVPIGEALTAVRAKLSLNSSAVPQPLQIRDVIQLLKTVFALTYFHHDGKVFRQVAGLPMWSASCLWHSGDRLQGHNREESPSSVRPLPPLPSLCGRLLRVGGER